MGPKRSARVARAIAAGFSMAMHHGSIRLANNGNLTPLLLLQEGTVEMDEKLREIVSDIFRISLHQVHRDLAPESVDEWDSLNHLRLITQVEEDYGVQFSMAEIREIDSLGALEDLVARYGGFE